MAHVEAHGHKPLPVIFSGCNTAIRDTRGAAIAVALLSPDLRRLTYASVGNVRTLIQGERLQRLPSTPGIVGAGYHPLRPLELEIGRGDLILIFTDGLQESLRPPADVAPDGMQALVDRLLHEERSGHDDAAILACLVY